MFQGVRLVTIHPALVHLPLGMAALAVIAFCWAAARHSARWEFAADVALWGAALSALLATAFGFVSFFVLRWPGGLEPWPELHLGFGCAAAALLLTLAAWRARRRRRGHAGLLRAEAGVMLVAGALVAFTGWIGGEILVFRSGMAVAAAGDGALAPAFAASSAAGPGTDVKQAMGQVRGAFAAIETDLAEAVAVGAEPALPGRVAAQAQHLEQLAHWLMQQPGADFQRFAGQLSARAAALRSSAAAGKLTQMVAAEGSIQQTCSACHEQLRWARQP